MIAAFTKDKIQRKWDELLPELQFAYNTSAHETTGFTPAQLNFGRELTAPGTLLAAINAFAGEQINKNLRDVRNRQAQLQPQKT